MGSLTTRARPVPDRVSHLLIAIQLSLYLPKSSRLTAMMQPSSALSQPPAAM